MIKHLPRSAILGHCEYVFVDGGGVCFETMYCNRYVR